MSHENHAAPGQLEVVRTLLNTWHLPNSTRIPEDRFDAFASQQGIASSIEADRLKRLRDDLRRVLEEQEDSLLNVWLDEFPLQAAVQTTETELTLRYQHSSGHTGDVLAIVLKAIEANQWKRLKACPDCRWVFYDHSRNASKKWCGMYARGPEGRACGTIAKVRRHRERQKRAEQKEK